MGREGRSNQLKNKTVVLGVHGSELKQAHLNSTVFRNISHKSVSVCVWVCVMIRKCGCLCAWHMCVWRSEHNLWVSVCTFLTHLRQDLFAIESQLAGPKLLDFLLPSSQLL